MKIRSVWTKLILLAASMIAGCTGCEVASEDFSRDGELGWTTDIEMTSVPELWIGFDMLTTMKEGDDGRTLEPSYDVPGRMTVRVNGADWYDGEVILSSDRFPVSVKGRTFVGKGQTCDLAKRRCELKGRIRVLELHHIKGGSTLTVDAKFPMTAGTTTVRSLRMELRD